VQIAPFFSTKSACLFAAASFDPEWAERALFEFEEEEEEEEEEKSSAVTLASEEPV